MELYLNFEAPKVTLKKLESYMAVELFDLFQTIIWTPSMSFYLPWIARNMKTLRSVSDFIKSNHYIEAHGQNITRAIIYDSKIAGIISYSIDLENQTEAIIGYFLGAKFTKKGLAISALKCLCENLIQQNLKPMLYIFPRNKASMKVAQRAGFSETYIVHKYNKLMLRYILETEL